MHKDTIETPTGTQNRRGAAYRKYADGYIINLDIMGKVVAEDVCSIFMNKQPFIGENDMKILSEINQQLFNDRLSNEAFALMILAFEFGFMRGGKAMRDRQRLSCVHKKLRNKIIRARKAAYYE